MVYDDVEDEEEDSELFVVEVPGVTTALRVDVTVLTLVEVDVRVLVMVKLWFSSQIARPPW